MYETHPPNKPVGTHAWAELACDAQLIDFTATVDDRHDEGRSVPDVRRFAEFAVSLESRRQRQPNHPQSRMRLQRYPPQTTITDHHDPDHEHHSRPNEPRRPVEAAARTRSVAWLIAGAVVLPVRWVIGRRIIEAPTLDAMVRHRLWTLAA